MHCPGAQTNNLKVDVLLSVFIARNENKLVKTPIKGFWFGSPDKEMQNFYNTVVIGYYNLGTKLQTFCNISDNISQLQSTTIIVVGNQQVADLNNSFNV